MRANNEYLATPKINFLNGSILVVVSVLVLCFLALIGIRLMGFSVDTEALCKKVDGCVQIDLSPGYSRPLKRFVWVLVVETGTSGSHELAKKWLRQEFSTLGVPLLFSDQLETRFVRVPSSK